MRRRMDGIRNLWTRVRTLVRREQVERELDDELSFHIDMQIEQYVRSGTSAREARRRALLLFGGMEGHKEAVRDTRWLRWAEDFWGDVRYAARGLQRSPGFTTIALLTLALGIGANSGLFGLVNALLFRSPPGLTDAGQLTRVRKAGSPDEVAYIQYREIVERSRAFDALAAYWPTVLDLGSGGEPLRVKSAFVSPNYFAVLGTRALHGRGFLLDEASSPVVVLGYDLWQRRFDGATTIVGKTIDVNGSAFTVIGIAPKDFTGIEFEDPAELWVPVEAMAIATPARAAILSDREFDAFGLVGRLREGVSRKAAQAELVSISQTIDAFSPRRGQFGYDTFRLFVEPLRGWYPASLTGELGLMIGFGGAITGLVLLVACANLANLLLARAVARRTRNWNSTCARSRTQSAAAAAPHRIIPASADRRCARHGGSRLVRQPVPGAAAG